MKGFLPVLVLLIFQTAISMAQTVQEKRLIYKTVDNRDLNVDMFYQETDGTAPAIALFHGGGWVFGDPSEFNEACKRYARMGFRTFTFQYRLTINEDGTYPHPDITPVESTKDARSAIRWLRENAGELKIDPNRIAVGGQSAGGQLALATELCDTVNEASDNLAVSPEPNILLLFSSNVNTVEAWIDMLLGERRGEIWSISPYHNLEAGMPPAIAFHGENDDQVMFYIVRMFRDKMNELGNSYELHTFPGRRHYLAPDNKKYATYFDEEILNEVDAFLKEQGFME